jgi:hypothetical protein
MTRQEIAALICRTIALLCLLAAGACVLFFGSMVGQSMLRGEPIYRSGDPFLLVGGTAVVSQIGVGIILWIFADDIGARMVSPNPDVVTKASFSSTDGVAVALALVGGFQLIQGCRDVVAYIFLASRMENPVQALFAYGPFWGSLAQIAISLLLILGWQGVMRFIGWLRTAGTPLADAGPISPMDRETRND